MEYAYFYRKEADFDGPGTWEGLPDDKIGVSDVVKGGGGYRSLVNVGENGGQEVPHLHFHLFGGEKVGKMVQ